MSWQVGAAAQPPAKLPVVGRAVKPRAQPLAGGGVRGRRGWSPSTATRSGAARRRGKTRRRGGGGRVGEGTVAGRGAGRRGQSARQLGGTGRGRRRRCCPASEARGGAWWPEPGAAGHHDPSPPQVDIAAVMSSRQAERRGWPRGRSDKAPYRTHIRGRCVNA